MLLPLRAETVLAAVVCAALCSAWVAVDAAPGGIPRRNLAHWRSRHVDRAPFVRGCFTLPDVPDPEDYYSDLEEDQTAFTNALLFLDNLKALKKSDDSKDEGLLLGSEDVETNTVTEATTEAATEAATEAVEDVAAETATAEAVTVPLQRPWRPWSEYFGGFPEYPSEEVPEKYPVYRGSSVGAKAWYRGLAAPVKDAVDDDDAPTRLTFSLIPPIPPSGELGESAERRALERAVDEALDEAMVKALAEEATTNDQRKEYADILASLTKGLGLVDEADYVAEETAIPDLFLDDSLENVNGNAIE